MRISPSPGTPTSASPTTSSFPFSLSQAAWFLNVVVMLRRVDDEVTEKSEEKEAERGREVVEGSKMTKPPL
jgi:hypothetical protein